jgi:hypothetical protein
VVQLPEPVRPHHLAVDLVRAAVRADHPVRGLQVQVGAAEDLRAGDDVRFVADDLNTSRADEPDADDQCT